MVSVRMLACDGCGSISTESDVRKVTITMGGKRMTVDACHTCLEPVDRLIDNHSKNKRTGRPSGLGGNFVLSDPSQIIKDNPRPKKRVVKRP